MPFQEVLPGVKIIGLWQENAWLLYRGDDAVLIDTGIRWDRKSLMAGLEQELGHLKKLRLILQTHAHCDHAGNTAYLRENFGCKIAIHSLEAPFLTTRKTYIPLGIGAISPRGVCFAVGEVIFPVERCPVDEILTEGDLIATPIGPLRVILTPGHTIGHISFFNEENGWLFSGDAIINVIPWLRKTALCLPVPVFSVDMSIAKQSACKLADLRPTALLAQHGHPRLQNVADDLLAFVQEYR
ncbi:MAG: MBL fold metallo-hydrolase [Chthonomonadales bacterium]